MSTVDERNEKIRQILDALYIRAIKNGAEIDESAYKDSLDKLFSTTAWGFREILLVVVIAMRLDTTFRASTRLYDCNPRAIYEDPIKEFLVEKNIPHRKSGPLNVAKATVGLDMTWAAQRRPSDVAREVVHLVNYMETDDDNSENKVNDIGTSLLRRLITYADSLTALRVETEPSEDPDYLYHLCYELITQIPDAGNTPQKISALLLKCYHTFFHTGIEVTVKHFDIARIRDSYDCISIYNEKHSTGIHEIIVICRREDCPPDMEFSNLHGYIGKYCYKTITYYYLNIYEWISNLLHHMTPEGRKGFYLLLNDYINETNTSESVKKLWKKLNSPT
ncbi:MAG: hypothetical protein NC318_14910 [Blautia sp.]|nr:hypothetical protein [Eubacterium sp.]MCM1212873.1 hypothetical protein [Blautia sp.]